MVTSTNLTIPPELFYSKRAGESWKPRCLSKIKPLQITRQLQNKTNKPKRARNFKGPQLGRVGKPLPKKITRKLIKPHPKKEAQVIAENENIDEDHTDPDTINEEELRLQIEQKEDAIREKLLTGKFTTPRRRSTSGNFKFFKSQMCDQNTPVQQKTNISKATLVDLDPLDFIDELETTKEDDAASIEALLENLEKTDDEGKHEISDPGQIENLDSLIGTLEGSQ